MTDETAKAADQTGRSVSEQRAQQPADLSPMLSATSERVQAVLDATDRAAEEILDSARAEAQKYVKETHGRAERLTRERLERISTLTEEVLSQTANIQRQADALAKVLEKSVADLGRELGVDQPVVKPAGSPAGGAAQSQGKPESQRAGTTSDVVPSAEQKEEVPTAAEEASAGGAGRLFGRRRKRFGSGNASEEKRVSDGARLVALQMRVAGEEDDAIVLRLREEFGVRDPQPILQSLAEEAPAR